MTFTKLFSSITESTVWCENDQIRIVWITMLAMANKNGFVFGSVPGLANRARVSVESAREAIEKFQQPDPDSRTKEHQGRRIEEVDGGWRLLTYEKHRAIRDEEERREYMKNLMRQKRLAKKVSIVSHSKPPLSQAEAEAYTEEETTKTSCAEPSSAPQIEAFIRLPLNDGTEYPVTNSDIEKWKLLYPAADIEQNLRKMFGWLDSRPAQRKTKKGIKSFINSWLSKEQDRGGNAQHQGNSGTSGNGQRSQGQRGAKGSAGAYHSNDVSKFKRLPDIIVS
jgi:hypothetical protein